MARWVPSGPRCGTACEEAMTSPPPGIAPRFTNPFSHTCPQSHTCECSPHMWYDPTCGASGEWIDVTLKLQENCSWQRASSYTASCHALTIARQDGLPRRKHVTIPISPFLMLSHRVHASCCRFCCLNTNLRPKQAGGKHLVKSQDQIGSGSSEFRVGLQVTLASPSPGPTLHRDLGWI